jgi:hypothetical protein
MYRHSRDRDRGLDLRTVVDKGGAEQTPARPEGLLLSDNAGRYYAVPCVVLERYQVPPELLPDYTPADGDGIPTPLWQIVSDIYAPQRQPERPA